MKRFYSFYISLIIFGSLVGCLPQEGIQDPVSNLPAKILTNEAYGSHPRQIFDLYLPPNRHENTPTLILVHGGGWKEGSKSDMNPFRDFLREQLPYLAIANLNYRLADAFNKPYPMQIEDISSLVTYLQDHREEYQLGSRLGFLGVSAGGHLSLLWSYAHDTDSRVQMVCSVVGPTDLLDESYRTATNESLREMLELFGEDQDLLARASPIYQVKADSPATLLFYGGNDPLVPNSQGMQLRDRLTELGVAHEFHFYPNEGHGWLGLNLLDSMIKLKAFVERQLPDLR
ncbi:alpha/beta hydrolase [Cyclobacterium jeungdonense]|uniref:Alpha/beta hydrolase n=1 Tax=Cyclobacterium jeungdonense TaxID=708087 RepID=A0ABT8CCD3_9BACT|nr:alpha/beta hydrolase [Cyclobacterium jeungdonense]MDN3690454.1 alpha/beta hydrolase [Cyclobacterium jeungdonense]